MKKLLTYWIIGLAIMFVFTYVMGINDDAYKRAYSSHTWNEAFIASFKYYFLWVLPYWWMIIFIGAIVLGLIIYGIRLGVAKAKR